MFAIQRAYLSGAFKSKSLVKNTIAGLVVGVVALPLAMAFAIASGVTPQAGIYTAIVAGIIVSICGGSQVQIAGPTGAFVVLLSGIVAQYGLDGLQIATIMGGIMLVLMSLAKLGDVIRFIPTPVITGFTAGIGITIFVGQWPYFFGFAPPIGIHDFHEKLWYMLQEIPLSHIPTLGIAVLSLILLLIVPKIPYIKVFPAPIVAMIIATILQFIYQFEGVATIGSAFGGIPQGLPSFTIPVVTWDKIAVLIGPAFTIAMLGAIESLLSAVVADGMSGKKHDSNTELLGQGLANIVAPLLGGIAATGAIARTATNIRSGGDSPVAGIVHAIVLLIILLLLAPYAVYIPLSSMAAILFLVSYNMSDVKRFSHIVRLAPRVDVGILLITFLLTIFTDLVIAVNLGVMLSILFFMRRMIGSIDIHEVKNDELMKEIELEKEIHTEIMVYTIEGPLFFGAVIIKNLKERKVEVLLSDVNYEIRRQMYRLEYQKVLGRHHLWRTCASALHKAEHDLEIMDEVKRHKLDKNK